MVKFYPARVILADDRKVVVRFEQTGQEIAFPHTAPNAVPTHLRESGAKGFVSFPKAPPVFSEHAA
jgi:hypothetical protein